MHATKNCDDVSNASTIHWQDFGSIVHMTAFLDMPQLPHGETFALVGRWMDDGFDRGCVAMVVSAGRIESIVSMAPDGMGAAHASSPAIPARRFHSAMLSPGFVDLQVNGGFGFEVGNDPQALRELAARLPATGVTAFLPTLVSRAESDYAPAFCAFAEATRDIRRASAASASAHMLGLHLEGPLLSLARRGAHAPEGIAATSALSLRRILAEAPDSSAIRVVTLAPERDDALALIADLRARDIAVSLGHTEASFEIATAAIEAGASLATHVFNAMPPLHHRNPGVVGAVLADDRVTTLFIADGVHVHPAVLKLAMRGKPARRRALVTDAISAAGLPPGSAGTALLAGQDLRIDATSARLADGTLAGSTLTLDRAVRNTRAFTDLAVADVLRMVTSVPAAAIQAQPHGRLSVGGAADIVMLDDSLEVTATFVGGRLAFVRDGTLDAISR